MRDLSLEMPLLERLARHQGRPGGAPNPILSEDALSYVDATTYRARSGRLAHVPPSPTSA